MTTNEWYAARRQVEAELSDQQPIFCLCGRLATGLHESGCKRFQDKVTRETKKRIKEQQV